MRHVRFWRLFAAALVVSAWAPAVAHAQYFGRNKVQYRSFKFQILKTDHFDIYYYPEEEPAAQIVARMSERWYARLSRFFSHEMHNRQVLILYASPAHFRQTNAVEGLVGEGIGGVTEAVKRRIVLPMSGSLADSDHVIGHELVHAFQFDMTGTDPRDGADGSAPGILQYPLWFVEGMAEYLSLGPVDAQTAMWMRDAALREKLPSVKDLDKPEYFPYRWGHAFWAFVGAKYGDRAVASLVRSAANPRFDLVGLARQLGTDPDTLTADWHAAIYASTEAALEDRPQIESEPRLTISKASGAGRFNVGPKLSPDGRQVAFFSERDRFSIELYLADAETGHITRKLVKSATDPHFDSLQFLNSGGAWSPDGKTLALAAVRNGAAVVAMIDPASGSVRREIALPGLDDAINPAFSPDGRTLVVSGNHGGFIDLYRIAIESGRMDQLTHDAFADLEPVFAPDGQSVIFVTERYSTDLQTLTPGPLRLARLDLATKDVTPIAAFLRGKQISPQVSADGRTLVFVAEPDGISNLYRMPIDGGPILQISSFPTGVAGITSSSPTLTASASGRLAFSVFENDGHAIYVLDPDKIVSTVAREATAQAAVLPGRTAAPGEVQRMLADPSRGLPAAASPAPTVPYEPKLKLDMLVQPTISAGVSQFGGYVSGSMAALFSDMLGDRMLGVSAQVSGNFRDLGGQLMYLNRKHRWNWGGAINQMPYRGDNFTAIVAPERNVVTFSDAIERQTHRGGSLIAAFPFSPAMRVEFSGGGDHVSFTREVRTQTYSADTRRLIDQTVTHTTLEESMYLASGSVALVYDTSFFGATSPILGRRYRFEVAQSAGSLSYSTVQADWRRYFMPKRPVTMAFRVMHVGRYGADAEDSHLVNLYAGYPELVHGYGFNSLTLTECQLQPGGSECRLFNKLSGSRLLVANAEVRAPLVGLFRHDIQYGMLPIEVAAFVDSGVTWSRGTSPVFAGGTRDLLRSVGGAVRVNAFGLLIVEIAASHPLDRLDQRWQWQIGIRQGF